MTERLQKRFEIDLTKAIKGLKEGEGTAVIAQFNVVDKDGDVTLPGAFGTQEVNMLPAHDFQAPRLGKATISEADDMAIAAFKFNLDPNAKTALEWYAALKFDMENGDPLQEWSYGFEIIDSSFGTFQEREVRFLKSVKVFEISPVLRGAGIGTGTLAMKDKKTTFKEGLEMAMISLADIKAIIERTSSLAELRAKDGRTLSEENQKAFKSFKALLDEVSGYYDKTLETIKIHSKKEVQAVGNLVAEYEKFLFENKHLIGAENHDETTEKA